MCDAPDSHAVGIVGVTDGHPELQWNCTLHLQRPHHPSIKAKDGKANDTAEHSCFEHPLLSELKEQAITIDVLQTCEETNDLHASCFGHILSGLRRSFHRFSLTEEPALTLPSPPSDKEKTLYLETHRSTVCWIDFIYFLAGSYGVWLCALGGGVFYWLGLFVIIHQINLACRLIIGIFSRGFDYNQHQKIVQEHSITKGAAPTVDIYLPCCREPLELLENTYKHVQKLQYPTDRLKFYVLDDADSQEVKDLATRYGFNYLCRDDRPYLKKAGNLKSAFRRTAGDFFVIFDADSCPRYDFLLELIPRMKADPNIAIVECPQYFRALGTQTWVERGAGAGQELFNRFSQNNQMTWNGSICSGSGAVYRRKALLEIDGVVGYPLAEDIFTGFYVHDKGWILSYIPLCLTCGSCPDTPQAFFSQQVRWCEGWSTLAISRNFWRSNLTKIQKICYLSVSFFYATFTLTAFAYPLPGVLIVWFNANLVPWYNLAALTVTLHGFLLDCLWTRGDHSGMCIQFISVIQQYAFLVAMKNSIRGTLQEWIPTGNRKSHQSSQYYNIRRFSVVWILAYFALFIAGCVYQVLQGYPWQKLFPMILIYLFMFFKSVPFLLAY